LPPPVLSCPIAVWGWAFRGTACERWKNAHFPKATAVRPVAGANRHWTYDPRSPVSAHQVAKKWICFRLSKEGGTSGRLSGGFGLRTRLRGERAQGGHGRRSGTGTFLFGLFTPLIQVLCHGWLRRAIVGFAPNFQGQAAERLLAGGIPTRGASLGSVGMARPSWPSVDSRPEGTSVVGHGGSFRLAQGGLRGNNPEGTGGLNTVGRRGCGPARYVRCPRVQAWQQAAGDQGPPRGWVGLVR